MQNLITDYRINLHVLFQGYHLHVLYLSDIVLTLFEKGNY